MKVQTIILSAIVLLTACNTQTKPVDRITTDTASLKTDTTGLAEFQAWKAQNELGSEKDETQAGEKTSVKAVEKTRSASSASANTSENNVGTSAGTQKKGWSKTAKGAVIGGVAGAAGGAIINKKNRAGGAVIGGVLGAGTGAIIGNEMDKKDGRH